MKPQPDPNRGQRISPPPVVQSVGQSVGVSDFVPIRVHVPVRIADIGGWTDTWFAKRGVVCNLAAGPGVTVSIESTESKHSVLDLRNLNSEYVLDVSGTERLKRSHPMLAECWMRHGAHQMSQRSVRISLDSAVPAGSSLGTSASVGVGVIAALQAASGGGDRLDKDLLAQLAHSAETRSGLESGVQDHVAAAHGGINLIDIEYPSFSVRPLNILEQTFAELDRRLITVYFGRPHESSVLHEMVIARLEATGSGADELEYLRSLAVSASNALEAGDLDAYGMSLIGTVEGQRALHPGLISADAETVLSIVRRVGGHMKVNGAGGPGGSVTLLGPDDPTRLQELRDAIVSQASWSMLSLRLWRNGVTFEQGAS